MRETRAWHRDHVRLECIISAKMKTSSAPLKQPAPAPLRSLWLAECHLLGNDIGLLVHLFGLFVLAHGVHRHAKVTCDQK